MGRLVGVHLQRAGRCCKRIDALHVWIEVVRPCCTVAVLSSRAAYNSLLHGRRSSKKCLIVIIGNATPDIFSSVHYNS